MSRNLLGTVAIPWLLIAALNAATAADMPLRVPSAAPQTHDWTGWYAGLNGGGNWGKSQAPMTISGANPAFTPGFNSIASQGFNTSGLTGGIQGGYNWQTGNVLLGFEVDFEYFRSAGTQTLVFPTPNGPLFTSTITKSVSTDWLLTARPRLGLVLNNWLLYGTGGLALTQLKASWNYSDTAAEASNASASLTKTGWTVGGGVEVALPGNWLVGGEYLYVKFPSASAADIFTFQGAPTSVTVSNSADLAANIIRARLSRKF